MSQTDNARQCQNSKKKFKKLARYTKVTKQTTLLKFGGGTPIRIITILHWNDNVPHMKGNQLTKNEIFINLTNQNMLQTIQMVLKK